MIRDAMNGVARVPFAWVVATAITTAAMAAVSAQGPIFRSRTELAVLNVAVTDHEGHVVRGLTADRFDVREEGAPRPVAALTTGIEPLSLVLAIDASESMDGSRFAAAKEGVMAFFAARRPGDDYLVLGFNDRVFPIAAGAQSADVIRTALDSIKPVGNTALYASVTTAVDSLRKASNRRRALVVISDGRDSFLLNQPESVQFERRIRLEERIQRSEALVYAIGINPPVKGWWMRMPDRVFDENALRQLTDPSGGVTYVVQSEAAVPAAAATIVDDLRDQYVLGFEPARPGDGKFHRVSVKVSGCDCRVRTTRGFVALPADSR